jgi:hypothetical protein
MVQQFNTKKKILYIFQPLLAIITKETLLFYIKLLHLMDFATRSSLKKYDGSECRFLENEWLA